MPLMEIQTKLQANVDGTRKAEPPGSVMVGTGAGSSRGGSGLGRLSQLLNILLVWGNTM